MSAEGVSVLIPLPVSPYRNHSFDNEFLVCFLHVGGQEGAVDEFEP